MFGGMTWFGLLMMLVGLLILVGIILLAVWPSPASPAAIGRDQVARATRLKIRC